jgi:hypothetical protein
MKKIYFGIGDIECPSCDNNSEDKFEYLYDLEIDENFDSWEVYQCNECQHVFAGNFKQFWELDSYW